MLLNSYNIIYYLNNRYKTNLLILYLIMIIIENLKGNIVKPD